MKRWRDTEIKIEIRRRRNKIETEIKEEIEI
jgi:hypothetical protein